MYLSGEEIAYDLEVLKKTGITHIINLAGNVCANKFEGQFKYRRYFLKDSKLENIECLFYETNFFIQDVLKEGGKVLVHCVQGVSRSVTICIAYLIWKFKYRKVKIGESGIFLDKRTPWEKGASWEKGAPGKRVSLPKTFIVHLR